MLSILASDDVFKGNLNAEVHNPAPRRQGGGDAERRRGCALIRSEGCCFSGLVAGGEELSFVIRFSFIKKTSSPHFFLIWFFFYPFDSAVSVFINRNNSNITHF